MTKVMKNVHFFNTFDKVDNIYAKRGRKIDKHEIEDI